MARATLAFIAFLFMAIVLAGCDNNDSLANNPNCHPTGKWRHHASSFHDSALRLDSQQGGLLNVAVRSGGGFRSYSAPRASSGFSSSARASSSSAYKPSYKAPPQRVYVPSTTYIYRPIPQYYSSGNNSLLETYMIMSMMQSHHYRDDEWDERLYDCEDGQWDWHREVPKADGT